MSKQETTGKEFYESADKVITVERQETLKEAAEWLNKKFDGKGVEIKIIDWGKNERYNYPPSKLLEEYTKWQSERMYSEEEVELITNEMVNWAIDNIGNQNPQSGKKFDEVLSKFKKK